MTPNFRFILYKVVIGHLTEPADIGKINTGIAEFIHIKIHFFQYSKVTNIVKTPHRLSDGACKNQVAFIALEGSV